MEHYSAEIYSYQMPNTKFLFEALLALEACPALKAAPTSESANIQETPTK